MELENDHSYFLNLTLTSVRSFSFYFPQSNFYNKIFQCEINTEYFQQIPIFSESKILLDMTLIIKGNKMLIEYEYLYPKDIKVYGYYSEDKDIIQNASGEELKLIEYDKCQKNFCQHYLRKNSADLKYAIIKISSEKSTSSINIKYGKQEKYFPTTIYLSCGIGLAVASPNIFIHIYNKCREYSDSFPIIFLLIDIFFHLGFFNFISKFGYFGGNASFIIGIFFLGFYLISLYYYFIKLFKYEREDYIKSGLGSLNQKLKVSKTGKTIEEALNENKVLKPKLLIRVSAFHIESREKLVSWEKVHGIDKYFIYKNDNYGQAGLKLTYEKVKIETWSDCKEIIYNSWQNETNIILENKGPILNALFNYKINFDEETSSYIQDLKNKMIDEAKTHDAEASIEEDFYVPGFKKEIICRPKNNENENLLFLILGFMATIFGFNSLINFFLKYK